jgi:hypothetical protein
MITGFAPKTEFPKFTRTGLLKATVLFLRVASLGAAVAYAVVAGR